MAAAIYSLDHVPIETLRRLAMEDPAQWHDAYDDEMVRRHPAYREWLESTARSDTPANLAHYRAGHR